MGDSIDDLVGKAEGGQRIKIFFGGLRDPYEGFVLRKEIDALILGDKLSDKYSRKAGEEIKIERVVSEISRHRGKEWRFRDIKGDSWEDPLTRKYEQMVGYLVIEYCVLGSART